MCLTTLALLATAQSSFGQLAFRTPVERSRAFFNWGVAPEGSVVSHIEKRSLLACRDSDLRSNKPIFTKLTSRRVCSGIATWSEMSVFAVI